MVKNYKLTVLKADTSKQNKQAQEKTMQYLSEFTTLAEKENYIASWVYSKSLNKQYKQDNANTDKQKENTLKRLVKDYYKQELANKLNKLTEAEEILQTSNIESINIMVEWVKNQTWGNNPHAVADIYATNGKSDYYLSGRASGCGYDKRSTAVANALNGSKILKAYLYRLKNNCLKTGEKMPYGSGNSSTLPYFEGGCGVSTTIHILNKLGFKTVVEDETAKHSDYYAFSR